MAVPGGDLCVRVVAQELREVALPLVAAAGDGLPAVPDQGRVAASGGELGVRDIAQERREGALITSGVQVRFPGSARVAHWPRRFEPQATVAPSRKSATWCS